MTLLQLVAVPNAGIYIAGQGRLDGAVCEYEEEDKQAFLCEIQKLGIKNIEMEATQIASLCSRTGRRAGMICVTLLNRLDGDQVDISPDVYKEYQRRPLNLVIKFIKHSLMQLSDGTRKRAVERDDSTKAKKSKPKESQ